MPIKHGLTPWIKQGQLPSGRGMAKIKKHLADIQDRLIDSLGGVKEITPQQEILAHSTIKGLGVMLLVELYINKEGPIRKDLLRRGIVELQPVLGKSYVAFLNSIRQNLLALGLDRKQAETILTPFEIAEKIDEEKARERKIGRPASTSCDDEGNGEQGR